MGFNRSYRSVSVAPSYSRPSGILTYTEPVVVKSSRRLPAYCPPQGQYYGYSAYATSAPKHVIPKTTTHAGIYVRPTQSQTSTRYFDLGYPTRSFGSRLSKGYSTANISRPEIYEQTYGVSYLPGYGRDMYRANTIAGATVDDSNDLVSMSCRRDNQALRNVENTIANIGNPSSYQKTFVRASSVPPQHRYSTGNSTVKSTRKPGAVVVKCRPVRKSAHNSYYHPVTAPKVQCHYETVNKGSDLLTAKEKLFAREFVDLTSPSGTHALRMRIIGAQNTLAKQGALLDRYTPTTDDPEVDETLRLMKAKRSIRAKSHY